MAENEREPQAEVVAEEEGEADTEDKEEAMEGTVEGSEAAAEVAMVDIEGSSEPQVPEQASDPATQAVVVEQQVGEQLPEEVPEPAAVASTPEQEPEATSMEAEAIMDERVEPQTGQEVINREPTPVFVEPTPEERQPPPLESATGEEHMREEERSEVAAEPVVPTSSETSDTPLDQANIVTNAVAITGENLDPQEIHAPEVQQSESPTDSGVEETYAQTKEKEVEPEDAGVAVHVHVPEVAPSSDYYSDSARDEDTSQWREETERVAPVIQAAVIPKPPQQPPQQQSVKQPAEQVLQEKPVVAEVQPQTAPGEVCPYTYCTCWLGPIDKCYCRQ